MWLFQFFAGLCGALMFGVGLLGAGCAAVVVDKTKKFEEVAKGGLSLSCTFLFGFLVVCSLIILPCTTPISNNKTHSTY